MRQGENVNRRRSWRSNWLIAIPLYLLVAAVAQPAAGRALEFRLTYDRSINPGPFTGRVFVMLTKEQLQEPPLGPNWFNPLPFFALDVKDWKPGQVVTMSGNALGFPVSPSQVAPGTYWAMAVMDLDLGDRSFAAAEGNGYSRAVRLQLKPGDSIAMHLHLDQTFHAKLFKDSDRIKLVDIPSKLLSEFHGRPVRLRAGIALPASYAANPMKQYPVLYDIPGFGGTHMGTALAIQRGRAQLPGVDIIYVVLDPSCRWGHHVFADSDNNGPCGRALVEEMIPAIEKRFRAIGTPSARLLTGHSSGGWSSLWLQVAYPEFFGGVWSTAPDPVDFRAFQRLNIYEPGADMFTDEDGKPRPLGRRGDKPVLFAKPFSDMEEVMGHGGQLVSFEAVFSPRDKNGRPCMLWDRTSGKVDPKIARSWQRYDIRMILDANWPTLAPKLAGKLHIYCGGEDTFYLERAVLLLKDALTKLGSDAKVEIVPGKDHRSLMDRKMLQRIAQEMANQLKANLKS
jgi:hypothetical protein